NVSAAGLFINNNGDKLRFQITSNRFLSKMVRIIIGRLLDIGQGRMSVDEFENHLINKTTPQIIIPAYPQGLYLSKVTYPYLDLAPGSTFSAMLQTVADIDWQAV
ncbi:MAG: tRNA pseudouridine38-40 synthase, partial [Mucilaginibacter sp.]|nr:tRNA pseudouridine38-40 synthase [Mucilaginibacter sp.]